MREGWKVTSLGHSVRLIRNGISCKQRKSGPGSRVTRIQTIAGSKIDPDKVGYADLSEVERQKFRLEIGDILFSHINSPIHVGKTAHVDEDYGLIHGMNLLCLRAAQEVAPRFLEYYLKNLYWSGFWTKRCKQSVNQASVNQQDIKKVPFSYPPLAEQKRIVTILDEAFAGIATAVANTEKNLGNARELFESYLCVLFARICKERGVVKLGDVCRTGSGGTPRKSERRFYIDGRIPWLLSGEVSRREITEASKFITECGLKNSSAKMFPVNTVLVAMYGATAGQAGILRFASATNQAVCGVYPNGQFLPEFLYYNFLYRNKELVATASGNAQPNISQIKIKSVLVPDLPADDQATVIEGLDLLCEEVDRLAENYKRKLRSLTELKQSLLEKAFSGKLTIAPQDEIETALA